MILRYLFVLLVCFVWHKIVEAQSSLKEKIYFSLNEEEYHMCFKRLNETHQIGCTSKKNGNVGVLHLLEKDADLSWLDSKASVGSYIVLMTMNYFNGTIMKHLIGLKKVTGVMVDFGESSARPFGYSPDKKIPNEEFSIYNSSKIKWNKFGDGLLFMDIPFPIALLTNSGTIGFLRECHNKHNLKHRGSSDCPLCAARMKSFMYAAVDSVVCHRRSHMQNNLNPEEYCDPIGSYNILSSLGPWNPDKPRNDSVILISARMDAVSMFDGISPGYDSSMTGFVALQSVAGIIGRVKDRLRPFLGGTPVVFALFHGESMGQTGSTRFVYDMTTGDFRFLEVSSIRAIIELGQLGIHRYDQTSDQVWVHSDRNLCPHCRDKLNRVISALTNQTGKVRVLEANRLPPSSVHSFLKKNPNIAGVYLSNHAAEFTNRYYNAFLDDVQNVAIFNRSESGPQTISTVEYVEEVSSIVACAIYTLVTDRTDCGEVISPEANYTKDLFQCFGVDADCELLNSTVFKDGVLSEVKSHFKTRYAGVFTDHSKAYPVMAHRALLARSLGDKVDLSLCGDQDFKYVNDTTYLKFKGTLNEKGERSPECHRAYVVLPYAVPPVFNNDELLTGTGFSTWTESRWNSFSIDVFLLPCYAQEVKTVILGVVVVALFIPVLIFINFKLLKGEATEEA